MSSRWLLIVIVCVVLLRRTSLALDPWILDERLSLYGTLLNSTDAHWQDSASNVLWGLPLQLEWQNRSGRLSLPNGTTLGAISDQSWWACMNYYLSVVPYLGATQAQLVAPLTNLTSPSSADPGKFCVGTNGTLECAPAIQAWSAVFSAIASSSVETNSSLQLPCYEDPLLAVYWTAHTTSLHEALPLFTAELQLMSKEEQRMGLGWANFVEMLASSLFDPAYDEVFSMQQYLPPRVLTDSDHPPFIANFSRETNELLLVLDTLADGGGFYEFTLADWKRAMNTSSSCRCLGRQLIQYTLQDPLRGAEIALEVSKQCL